MITLIRNIVAMSATMFFLAHTACAHDMDLNVQVVSPGVIKGQLSFSDDSSAKEQYIRIENLTDNTFSAVALQTDNTGQFQVTGVHGHRYLITAEGNEGHSISIEVDLKMTSDSSDETDWPPLYIFVAMFLLLSLIPAHRLKK